MALLLTVFSFAANANAAEMDTLRRPAAEWTVIPHAGQAECKLVFVSDAADVVRVRIYNEQGALLHKDVVRNHNAFIRKYNMTSLTTGKYIFEVREGNLVKRPGNSGKPQRGKCLQPTASKRLRNTLRWMCLSHKSAKKHCMGKYGIS